MPETPSIHELPDTLLLVEDDPKVVKLFMEFQGEFKLVVAKTSNEAQRLLETIKFSLLLLDWHLYDPKTLREETGRDVLIAARELDPLVPIIVMSGGGLIDVANESLELGADVFFAKPLRFNNLLKLIRRFMARQRNSKQSLLMQSASDIRPLKEIERLYTKAAFELLGDKSETARRLGVHRHTINTILSPSDTTSSQDTTSI